MSVVIYSLAGSIMFCLEVLSTTINYEVGKTPTTAIVVNCLLTSLICFCFR